MDPKELGRRVRAARTLGGFKRAEDLAAAIELSRTTILKIERGERRPKRFELWAIAEVCHVPREFFESEQPTPDD